MNLQGMESFVSFESLSLWGSKKKIPENILKFRKEKIEFEQALQLNKFTEFQKNYIIPVRLQLFSAGRMNNNAVKFLQYVYYKKFHKNELFFNLSDLLRYTILLHKCQNARLLGYSALGAAVIAKDITYEEKKLFIELLMAFQFVPTDKDKELAYLEWHERTPLQERIKFLLVKGSKDPGSVLSTVPLEIIKYISIFIDEKLLFI